MEKGCHVVFGASGGIGSELARCATAAGQNVVPVSRAESEGSERCAFGDSAEVESLMARIRAERGPITRVTSCIGSLQLAPLHRTTDEMMSEALATHLMTAFWILRASVRGWLEDQVKGSAVFCSSVAAGTGLPNHEAVGAAKAGLEGLIRSAAATYAGKGIRINGVAPGLVETPLTARFTQSEASRAAVTKMNPMNLIGTPAHIAQAILFLHAEPNTWMTGQILGVDGGLGRLRV